MVGAGSRAALGLDAPRPFERPYVAIRDLTRESKLLAETSRDTSTVTVNQVQNSPADGAFVNHGEAYCQLYSC